MTEPKRTELSVQAERALLVGVILPRSNVDPHDPLGELRSLVKTAGAKVVDEMIANRHDINGALYVGTGKAQEIADRCEQNDITTIIFDNDLHPNQIRDLEEVTGRKVLDRSELILDIFAAHAQTAESRLQVELAQLEYTYPRLHHMWSHLERLAGGASSAAASVGGIGTRGPGEKQLEIDRRLVQKRVSMLKREIEEIDRRKLREVKSRKDVFSVCLVGYTNAGKSTLMNLLTGADTYVADKLFATLDTKTRRWNMGEGQSVLLSDTVGFVANLPHHLVASFRATLEEAIHGHLLLHVADASHDRVEHQIAAVEEVLDQLGCDRSKVLLVLNKIDQIKDPATFTLLDKKYPGSVFLSALTGQGAEKLLEEVIKRSGGRNVRVRLRANFRNGKLMGFLAQHAKVDKQTYNDSTTEMEASMAADKIEMLRMFGKDVEVVKT